MHQNKTQKKLKGFTLSEMVITMCILAIFLAVSIPMFTLQKSYTGQDKDAYTCIVKEGAANLNSTACTTALSKCERNKGNTCNSILSLVSTYSDPALTLLGKACTDGGKQACNILINRCIDNSANCDIAGKTYDIHNYLVLSATDTSVAKILMYDLLKEKISLGISNVYNEVIGDCQSDSTSMACTLIGHKLYDFNTEDEPDFIEQSAELGTIFKNSNAQIVSSATPTSTTAYAWGLNAAGQIGDNTNVPRRIPTAVSGGINFSQITAEYYTACGITASGKAYCWGDNAGGQIGDNTTLARRIPTAVSSGTNFSQISIGYSVACGVEKTTNTGYCWGNGSWGRLGGSNLLTNTPISGGLAYKQISGSNHICGLTTSGAAYYWGYWQNTDFWSPTAVGGGLTFSQITAGSDYNCALDAVGKAYCWGKNDRGQLGDNTITNAANPVPVVGPDGLLSSALNFSQISAGSRTACGIEKTTKKAYCWGYNNYGQIGDNTTNEIHYPKAVVGPDGLLSSALMFSQITSETNSNCGITTSGAAYCWGYNFNGQLGDNTTTDKKVPTAVNGGLAFSSINGGDSFYNGLVPAYVYYITTSDSNQVANIKLKIIKATITQTTPANTNIKYLVSFDARNTWYKWNGSAWVLVDTSGGLASAAASGSTASEIQTGLTNYTLPSGATTVDIAAFLSTTNPASATPLLDKIDIWYY